MITTPARVERCRAEVKVIRRVIQILHVRIGPSGEVELPYDVEHGFAAEVRDCRVGVRAVRVVATALEIGVRLK